MDNSTNCDFVGDSDIYGIGIRIGFYLQTAAAALSLVLQQNHGDAQSSAVLTNQWFSFALMIALFYTTTSGTLSSSEIYVASTLLIATFHVPKYFDKTPKLRSAAHLENVATKTGKELYTSLDQVEYEMTNHYSLLTTNILNMARVGCIAYLYWFWFKGYTSERRAAECTDWVFFFTKVRIDGWVKWPMRVLIIYHTLISAFWLPIEIAGFVTLVTSCFFVSVSRLKFDSMVKILKAVYLKSDAKKLEGSDTARKIWNRLLKWEWIRWILYIDMSEIKKFIETYKMVPRSFEEYYQHDAVLEKLQAELKPGKYSTGKGKTHSALQKPDLRPAAIVLADEPREKTSTSVHHGEADAASSEHADEIMVTPLPFVFPFRNVWELLLWFLKLAILVLAIELAIRWNRIQDINQLLSAGQLIPFILGLVSFCQVFKTAYLRTEESRKTFPDISTWLKAAFLRRYFVLVARDTDIPSHPFVTAELRRDVILYRVQFGEEDIQNTFALCGPADAGMERIRRVLNHYSYWDEDGVAGTTPPPKPQKQDSVANMRFKELGTSLWIPAVAAYRYTALMDLSLRKIILAQLVLTMWNRNGLAILSHKAITWIFKPNEISMLRQPLEEVKRLQDLYKIKVDRKEWERAERDARKKAETEVKKRRAAGAQASSSV